MRARRLSCVITSCRPRHGSLLTHSLRIWHRPLALLMLSGLESKNAALRSTLRFTLRGASVTSVIAALYRKKTASPAATLLTCEALSTTQEVYAFTVFERVLPTSRLRHSP